MAYKYRNIRAVVDCFRIKFWALWFISCWWIPTRRDIGTYDYDMFIENRKEAWSLPLLQKVKRLETKTFKLKCFQKFFRNFLLKYQTLVAPSVLKPIQDFIIEVYGEKLYPHLSHPESLKSIMHPVKKRTVRRNVKDPRNSSSGKEKPDRLVRRGYYRINKNDTMKLITVPFRKS